MQYMTVKQASERWGISDRRVRLLCAEGRIEGVGLYFPDFPGTAVPGLDIADGIHRAKKMP